MKPTKTSFSSMASKIVRNRSGSARLPSAYIRHRSLSMSNEIEREPRFQVANMREIDQQPPYTSINPAKLSEPPMNNVAKLRQHFDRPTTPETDLPVALTNTATLPSSDSGKRTSCDVFYTKNREKSSFIGFALAFFLSNHKIQLLLTGTNYSSLLFCFR